MGHAVRHPVLYTQISPIFIYFILKNNNYLIFRRCAKEKKLLAANKFTAELGGKGGGKDKDKAKPAANGKGAGAAAKPKDAAAAKKEDEEKKKKADEEKKKKEADAKKQKVSDNVELDDDEITTDDEGRSKAKAGAGTCDREAKLSQLDPRGSSLPRELSLSLCECG
jgi:hypothetical protein